MMFYLTDGLIHLTFPIVHSHIAGIALFGDTQNKQSGGHIKNFPQEKSKVFCESNDGVCGGLLNVNAGHLAYMGGGGKLKEGAEWLIAQVKGFTPPTR
jgi:cutinase